MIIRIVRMHFREDEAGKFLEIFNSHKEAIRNFEGCSHLELLKEPASPNSYTTLSHWKSLDYLEAYRTSPLFKSVWSNVKILFSEKSQYYSFEKFIEL